MKKKLLVLLLVASLAILAMAIFPSAATTVKDFGNGIVATVDGTTMTISGQGDIPSTARSFISSNSGVTNIVIEEGITSIPAAMCYQNANLKSVTIASTVTSIGNNAFRTNTALKTVNIAENSQLSYVGRYAFESSGITSIAFSDALKTLDAGAFMKCLSLASVDLGSNLESMGEEVFRQSGVTSVDIRGTIVEIPKNAFYMCYKLASVSMGDSVLTIGNNAFRTTPALASIEFSQNLTTIKDHAFNAAGIKGIVIPDSVTTLGGFSFYGSDIQSLSLSSGLVEIPEYCFSATDLTTVEIPNNIKSIAKSAFSYCPITTLDLGEGVESLGTYAFAKTQVTSVVIPGTVTSLGTYVFTDCQNLDNVTFEEGNLKVGQQMFVRCSELTSVDLPSTITTIGSEAFYNCPKLSDVDFSADLTTIEKNAFRGTAITSAVIPAGVKNISAGVFQSCKFLASVTFDGQVNKIGDYAFYGCTSLTNITLNSGLATIGDYAFRESGLTSVAIPDGCTTIGKGAFYNSQLTNVYVPASITSLADKVVFRVTICKPVLHTTPDATYIIEWAGTHTNNTFCEECLAGNDCSHQCSFGEWAVTTAPTADATGLLTKACECGATETYTLPALNNTDYIYTVVTEATCTVAGEANYAITVDGQSFEFDVEIAAIGEHTYGQWIVTTPATPFANAVETATCVCGDTITREGAAYVGQAVTLDVQVNGTTATATLNIVGAPELSSLGFTIAYGDNLVLTGATTTLTGNTADPSIANPVKFVWVNGLENVDVNGTILTLTFTVDGDVAADDFTITYDADDICYVEDEVIVNVELETYVNVTVA